MHLLFVFIQRKNYSSTSSSWPFSNFSWQAMQ